MTNPLRPGLPPLPPKMRGLHIDKRGFPVPYFVAMVDGEPDHRIVDPRAMQTCVNLGRCWLCGQPLGAFRAFVIGPMCAINRINSEPPSHLECARYAVQACPFLTRPHAKRRDAGMPDQPLQQPAGVHLERNPGIALIWVTRTYRPVRAPGGVLFRMGSPVSVEFFAEGRAATREEVEDAISSGLPPLIAMATEDGSAADLRELDQRERELRQLVAEHFKP